MIEISRHAPEAVLDMLSPGHSLVNLISEGYDEGGRWAQNPLERTVDEYAGREHAVVFLAEDKGRAVGSMVLIRLEPSPENVPGVNLWEQLHRADPALVHRINTFNPLVCEVDSIVTDPNLRRRGIGRSLLCEAAAQLRPATLIGQTRKPAAVATRRHLDTAGYRTFCGTTEVTPDRPQVQTQDHLAVLNAYHEARQFYFDIVNTMHVMDTGIVYPPLSAEGYPDIVQIAFNQIRTIHNKYNGERLIMAPLLSIRVEILEDI